MNAMMPSFLVLADTHAEHERHPLHTTTEPTPLELHRREHVKQKRDAIEINFAHFTAHLVFRNARRSIDYLEHVLNATAFSHLWAACFFPEKSCPEFDDYQSVLNEELNDYHHRFGSSKASAHLVTQQKTHKTTDLTKQTPFAYRTLVYYLAP
ncbi:hypothetical protein OESDEN_00289 [Oesophagostomum dentatum]|uniref:Uncharacterized protein n=1 Tax=Oesophagostomum dentatum TaxID=61180 RepID=A0A0B1TQD1_OESDE|nr:hypothetical protein OESDEN_00289 [Oesophagostomum dentatum]